MAYKLTRKTLLLDLYVAFQCAKRHKASRPYVSHFERDLKQNLERMADDLLDRTYKPEPSSCFIVERPKKREVFAAQFRDRIMHHLYYNYTHELFERTFIQDTYSCIQGRGTHYGIERLKQHIRRESNNYQKECWVLELDKRGYFMHIDRKILLRIATDTLEKMRSHKIYKKGSLTWDDVVDMDFVLWLTEEIVLTNPKDSCRIVGSIKNWEDLDRNKSLFYTNEGCGLPIGNLTSQLLSNVYLNPFDQFMKRVLKCRHYGRYVDDSRVVSCDKNWLISLIPKIREYLKEVLHLDLHMGKLHIVKARYGVEFLGAYIKPYRDYLCNASLKRTRYNIVHLEKGDPEKVYRSVNAFLGTFVHYASYNIRCETFLNSYFLSIGTFNDDVTKMNKPQYLQSKCQSYEKSIWSN